MTRRAAAIPLGLGALALVAAVAVTSSGASLDALATPPSFVRAALVAASVVLGLALLARAIRAIDAATTHARGSDPEVGTLVRGIRFAFLAVACGAAAAGWILGHPLPLVVALVIAAIDVVETSFLLLVASRGRSG